MPKRTIREAGTEHSIIPLGKGPVGGESEEQDSHAILNTYGKGTQPLSLVLDVYRGSLFGLQDRGKMEYQLVLISGRKRGASFRIAGEGLTLGRDADVDVVISDPTVSRRHCRVFLQGEGVFLDDLGSLNPTLLNGMPASSSELRLGDEIAVGSWRFLLTSAEPSTALENREWTGAETWSWSKAQTIGISADLAAPPVDNRPRTVQDLAFLHSVTRELGEADTLADLMEVLVRHLVERFQPASIWVARVQGNEVLTSMQVSDPSLDDAPIDIIERALQEGRGLLAPGTARRGGRKVLLSTLVAPVRLAGINTAVIALQTEAPKGAYDENDLSLLVLMAQSLAPFVSAIESLEQLRRDNERLRNTAGESLALVGNSKAIRQVRASIARVAETGLTVLITGESGTGKELVARLLHAQSPRHSGPFVVVNCAAIPRDLFESEFFGYEKGAFTGAVDSREGYFALAHGGTLFLDEIGNLSPDNQARILRAIELGTFRRIGAQEESFADVRILAATNTDISSAIKKGLFREDLYHRLNGFGIHIPPLQERPSDIPVLAEYFFQMAKYSSKRPLKGFQPEAIEVLTKKQWPGNVRELRNVILRAVAVAGSDTIRIQDLGEKPDREKSDKKIVPKELLTLEEAEKRYIAEVVEACDGSVPKAAQILGIARSTLYRKLAEFGITP